MIKKFKGSFVDGQDEVFCDVVPASMAEELHTALLTCQRYILFIHSNEAEAGKPHPQQLLLDKIDDLRNRIEK